MTSSSETGHVICNEGTEMDNQKMQYMARGLAVILALAAIGGGTLYAGSVIEKNSIIEERAAENFAVLDAGVNEEEITDMVTNLERVHGKYVYEISFYAGGMTYDYEILAEDGTVIEKDIENSYLKETDPAADEPVSVISEGNSEENGSNISVDLNGQQNAQETKNRHIGIERAKQIALEDAGLTEDEVRFTTSKFDNDNDDGEVYEIEFYKGRIDYEFEIDAYTGEIKDKSVEIDDD